MRHGIGIEIVVGALVAVEPVAERLGVEPALDLADKAVAHFEPHRVLRRRGHGAVIHMSPGCSTTVAVHGRALVGEVGDVAAAPHVVAAALLGEAVLHLHRKLAAPPGEVGAGIAPAALISRAPPQRFAACTTASLRPGGDSKRASTSGASPIDSTRAPAARAPPSCQFEKFGGKKAQMRSLALQRTPSRRLPDPHRRVAAGARPSRAHCFPMPSSKASGASKLIRRREPRQDVVARGVELWSAARRSSPLRSWHSSNSLRNTAAEGLPD